MFRILHLADLHLGYRPELPSPIDEEVYRERNDILRLAVELALDSRQEIKMVIIAGDLFDNHRPETGLVEETIRQLARLQSAGIILVTVPGNHDEITYSNSVFRQEAARWPGLLVSEPLPAKVATFDLNGTPCHIVSMAYTGGVTRIDGPLDSFPPAGAEGVTLGIFHGSLDWNAGERSLPLDGTALAGTGYDYIALGHIHRGGERKLGRVMAVYAGMVAGRGFTDPGVGTWTLVTLGEGPARITKLPAATRAWKSVELDVSAFNDVEELEEAVKGAADKNALVQVKLKGTVAFNLNLQNITAHLGHLFYHLELVDATAGFAPELLRNFASEPTIRGLFVRRLLERLKEASGPEEEELIRRALWRGISAFNKGGAG